MSKMTLYCWKKGNFLPLCYQIKIHSYNMLLLSCCIAGRSQRVSGADRACVGEQPARGAAAATAAAADTKRSQRQRSG